MLKKSMKMSDVAFQLNFGVYRKVPCDRILPHPNQPADRVRTGIAELRRCIMRTRDCQPLSLIPIVGRAGWYYCLDGHRRLTVLKSLDSMIAPCMILPKDTDINAYFQHIQSKKPFSSIDTLASFAKSMSIGLANRETPAQLKMRQRKFFESVPNPRTRKQLEEFVALIGLRKTIAYGLRGKTSANIMTRLDTFVKWVGQNFVAPGIAINDRKFHAKLVVWMLDTKSYKALGVAEKLADARPNEKPDLVDDAFRAFQDNAQYTVLVKTLAYAVPQNADVRVTVTDLGVRVQQS
jgi:hypothetical protein